ncbi:MAG TPA: hypothetical protein VKP11_08325 [Frankiaceae bacterium]|nr:hypothetical protein [Frankiaceae bacterium]
MTIRRFSAPPGAPHSPAVAAPAETVGVPSTCWHEVEQHRAA